MVSLESKYIPGWDPEPGGEKKEIIKGEKSLSSGTLLCKFTFSQPLIEEVKPLLLTSLYNRTLTNRTHSGEERSNYPSI